MTLLFAVEDTGIGISREDLGLLFNEYKQVGAQNSKNRGTGLGLAITRKLVELMDGKIWVESALSKGSRFLFTLKLRVKDNNTLDTAYDKEFSDQNTLRPLKILLAEDNQVNAKLVAHILKKYGHSVDTVNNGFEVINSLTKEIYDFLIMDIEMPVMDGLVTTQL